MADKEFKAVGRRKTAIAIVRLTKGKGRVFINNKTLKAYLGERASFEMMIYQPLALTNNENAFDVKVRALGGGVSAQASAIRHGIAKALLEVNPENKAVLKAKVRIVPTYAVEDFDISLTLEDSVSGIVAGVDEE